VAESRTGAEKCSPAPNRTGRAEQLLERYRAVRNFTARLCAISSRKIRRAIMPDVSPTQWHLAHTSWFFETFIVKVWMPRYRPEVPQYAYLFIPLQCCR